MAPVITPTKAALAKAGKQPKAPRGSPSFAPSGLVIQNQEPVDAINAPHLAELQAAMDAILARPPESTAGDCKRR